MYLGLKLYRVLPLLLVAVVSCTQGGVYSSEFDGPEDADGGFNTRQGPAPVAPSILEAIERGESPGILLLLGQEDTAAAGDPSPTGALDVAALQREVLGALPAGALSSVRTYAYFPLIYAELSQPEALATLVEHPAVRELFEDRAHELSLAQSLDLIDQPEAESAGSAGAGTAVAVLDTGTDYTRAAFGSCSAPGTSGCRVAYVRDFAPNDGQLDAHGHGTNVAGIVAAVAPGTSIVGLDVFTGASAYSNVILEALEWVIANREVYNIVAINMSLGSGLYQEACAGDVFATAIQAARSAGIVPVVASGNHGVTSAISSPACTPAALSVGAVYDSNVGPRSYSTCTDSSTAADQVTCFSNSSPQLSMLAPGASILAAEIEMSGTSQAAPHVAGAAAVLAARFPSESADQRVERLIHSGPTLTDARNGLQQRRLDLPAALAASPGAGPTPTDPPAPEPEPEPEPAPAPGDEISGPQGTVSIEDGAAQVGTSRVSVEVNATDANGVVSMCVTNTRTCRRFVPFVNRFVWNLRGGTGTRTVFVVLRDGLGNQSLLSDSIVVDRTKPLDGQVNVEPGDGTVRLTMVGARDSISSELSYVIVGNAGTRVPSRCDVPEPLYAGPDPSALLSGLTNGVPLALRMCVRDAVGNTSRGVIIRTRPAPEFVPPTGSVLINGGAEYTTSREVTLSITTSDDSTVTDMCVSSTPRCGRFVSYTASSRHRLRRSAGLETVYVYLRDRWGNETPTALTDTILIDSMPPRDGQLSLEEGDATVQLTMTGAHDAHSNPLSYVVVGGPGTRAPTRCDLGPVLYSGSAATATLTGLSNGVQLALRMCARDARGNFSRGKTVFARPVPEVTPPTGSVSIAAGAEYSASRRVVVSINAHDASGVGTMCLSNRPRCTRFVPFTPEASFLLGRSRGVASVFVYLRDIWGNETPAPLTDTITMDMLAPTIHVFTAAQSTAGRIDLAWSASDAANGIASYELRYRAGRSPPPNCGSGTQLYYGQNTDFSHLGVQAGAHAYRLCARDNLGNTASRAYIFR